MTSATARATISTVGTPLFEGISELAYTVRQLAEFDKKCIEYNGVKYSEYEISQIQRKMEREIRSAKRGQVAFKVAVADQGMQHHYA